MAVTKDMRIVDIVQENPMAASILMAANMHCLGCVMATGENLEQACAVHGIDPDEMVKKLNEGLGE